MSSEAELMLQPHTSLASPEQCKSWILVCVWGSPSPSLLGSIHASLILTLFHCTYSPVGIFTSAPGKAGYLFFFFNLCPCLGDVPGLGINSMPEERPGSQQWQCQILNPLNHQGTATLDFLSFSFPAWSPPSIILSHKMGDLHGAALCCQGSASSSGLSLHPSGSWVSVFPPGFIGINCENISIYQLLSHY